MADTHLLDPPARRVTLHERTWFGHIVKGHPEVAAHRALAVAALEQPEEIRHSNADADCRLYIAAGPRPAVKMVVVADVTRGFVKTAYFAKRITGTIEWP